MIATRPAALRLDSGPNMTPLVDVVMVILIFLMLAGSFVTGRFLKAQAVGSTASPAPVTTMPATQPLDVFVDQSGVNDGFVARFGDETVHGDRDLLMRKLAGRRAGFESVGTAAEDVQVVIRPSPHVPYEQVAHVYEAALRAKFVKVAFATSGARR